MALLLRRREGPRPGQRRRLAHLLRTDVEVVRAFFRALESGDAETALNLIDPEVVWSPMEGTYHGVDGLATHWSEWIEPWAEHRIDPEEFVQAKDRVLAVIQLTAKGKRSGIEIDQRFFQLYTIREGRIARMTEFMDRAEALEAAGLRGGTGS